MSAAEVGVGGPPAPRRAVALVARVRALGERLRDGATRLVDPDDGAVSSWATALAKAPQAVPDLPRPSHKRLTRFILGFVVGAHVALVAALWWRSAPPPVPQSETTVELVREMPEAAKPKAPESKAEEKKPQPPVQEGKPTEPQAKPAEKLAKPEQHLAKQEPPKAKPDDKPDTKPKAEPRQPKTQQPAKTAHQRPAHRAPPPPQEQAQHQPEQQQPAPGAEHAQPEKPIAMPAIALPGASDAGTEAVSYQQLVLSQVAKAKKQGRYMGVPGYAGVRFRVAEDGSLENVKLVVSSGDANLDIEAEAMIRRAAPFPKPPPGGRRDYGITLVFAAQPAP